jgi:hypothetical protein
LKKKLKIRLTCGRVKIIIKQKTYNTIIINSVLQYDYSNLVTLFIVLLIIIIKYTIKCKEYWFDKNKLIINNEVMVTSMLL